MTYKQEAFAAAANSIIKNLEKRGMEGYFFEDCASCVMAISDMIPAGSVISWGGSESIKEVGLLDALKRGEYELIDRMTASTPEESRLLYSKAVMSDFFLMSSNAITYDGELVNRSHP
ncbi:MAG: LUD domain-containing protein [Lachnospiraceae bacterium]|nr:LUD domain-containing protein [Lachnospiraceae bacterium]